MCQNVVFLAQQANNRYISQCEHGTVHLLWDSIGLHLPGAAFRQLAGHILEARATVEAHFAAKPCGHCRLQVNKICLDLPVQEFLPLAAMVHQALPYVDSAERAPKSQEFRLMPPHQLMTQPYLN